MTGRFSVGYWLRSVDRTASLLSLWLTLPETRLPRPKAQNMLAQPLTLEVHSINFLVGSFKLTITHFHSKIVVNYLYSRQFRVHGAIYTVQAKEGTLCQL